MDKGEVAFEIAVLLAGVVLQDPGTAKGVLGAIQSVRRTEENTDAQLEAGRVLEAIIHQLHPRLRTQD